MRKHFNYNNCEIFYDVSGEGHPVVLLHGFAEDGSIWRAQSDFLQQFCKVIIPDLPGSGESTFLEKESVGIEDYATCLNALLEVEKIDNCILLAHSMGGYIALAFAEMFPGKLAGFGLVHSTAFADSEEKKNTRRKGIKFLEEHGAYPFIKNTTPNLFSERYKREHPIEVKKLIEQGKKFSKEALIQYYQAMIDRPDRTQVLKETALPVLFIIGTEDKAAPAEDLLKQVHLPKVSFIHIIPDAGHMSMMEKPAELNEHLRNFIDTVFSSK